MNKRIDSTTKKIKTKYKIVITGHGYKNLDIEKNILSKINAGVIDADKMYKKKLIQIIKDADGLIVGDTDVNKELISRMEKCKVISEYGIGVDNIDIGTATENEIVVANVPGYGTEEVANQAFALLMALARKICMLNNLTKVKGWSYARESVKPIFRLKNKVLGVIGCGRIGQAFSERAKPFGFKILVNDPYQNRDDLEKKGYIIATVERIIKESDFISIHCPLTEETNRLFDESKFKLMKRTAYLINVARGAIIDENALLKALKEKWIAGAGLDVLSDYELRSDNPLFNYFINNDNLLIVPHTAWYSEESEIELRTRASKAVVSVLSGEEPESKVNEV